MNHPFPIPEPGLANSETQARRRPSGVTLLSGLVLTFAAINLVRMSQAVIRWQFLEDLLPIAPIYLVITGLAWGVFGLITAVMIFWGKRSAPWLAAGLYFGYSGYYWIDRIFMPGYPGKNGSWPFLLMVNCGLGLWGCWILTRPKARKFFEGLHGK
jgi:hypothetical protein